MKVFWYADGSTKDGYGHLFRIISIQKLSPIHYENIFLYSNDTQKNFYWSKGINAYDIKADHDHDNVAHLIIDSKKNISELLEQRSLKKFCGKIILIDSPNMDSIDIADILIFPSFYINQDLVKQIKTKDKKVFFSTSSCANKFT